MTASGHGGGATVEVSVVIPTRNRWPLLARALASVLSQEDVDLEIIVVDEASEDRTAERVATVGDPRVSVVRNDVPLGVAEARNTGIASAKGTWVAFLDDDDLWAPGKLAAQLTALRGRPEAGWSCVDAAVVDEQLRINRGHFSPPDGDVVARVLAYNVIPGGGSGVLAATDLVRSVGGFDPNLRILADWDLWIRLGLRSSLAAVHRPLLAYLRHGGNMSSDGAAAMYELLHVAEKHAPARAEHGVDIAWERWRAWQVGMDQRAGRRLAPARYHFGRSWREGRPRAMVSAVTAALWPSRILLRDRRSSARLPLAFVREAEGWLKTYRQDVGPPSA